MKNILITIILISFFSCQPNNLDWSNLDEFIIYKEKGLDPSYLQNKDFFKLKTEKVIPLLKTSKETNSIFLWKGHWIAKASFNNKEVLFFKISVYSDIIYDLKNKKSYKLPSGSINILLNTK